MDGEKKIKKVGKRKVFQSSDKKCQSDLNDGLDLFVDAPRDVSDDGDSTDSEESVYSGLDEEESSEAESFEEMSNSEDDNDENTSADEESDDEDDSDDDESSDDDDDALSDEDSEAEILKTSSSKDKVDSVNNNKKIMANDEQQVQSSSKDRSKKKKTKRSRVPETDNEHIKNGDKETGVANEYSYDSSDEEDIRNTVGNIPMEWYKEYSHIGYGLDGGRILKPKTSDELDKFLNKMDNPDYWRTVADKTTGQDVVLSEQDLELIRGIRKGRTVESTQDPYAPWIDFFTHETMQHPVTNRPEHKRSFIPSKLEKLKVGRIVHAMKMGWIKPRKPEEQEETKPAFYMLWDKDDQNVDNKRFRHHIPAPKMALPGHEESYNPPPEYLFTEEEKLAWNEQDPEDRRQKFIPQKYSCLRHVPAFSRFINERFERCLDLYLCPRQRKMRMNVDPEDLIPKLPKPRDLQPFPTTQSIVYKGHAGLIRTLGVHPAGQWLVSGSDDETVKFWEVSTGRCMKTVKVAGVVKSVTWNPNPALNLVAIVVDKTVMIMNPNLGDKLISSNTDNMLSSYSAADDQQGKNNPVDWQECESKEYKDGFRLRLAHPKVVSKVTWHGKGDYFAVVMPEGGNMSTLIHQLSKRRSQNPFSKSKGLVQCVLFHPTRPYFFLATQRYIRVYNLLKQELTKKLLTNCKWVSSMAVHPGGDNLIVGSYDCRLSWFDLDLSTKPYKTLRHHKKAIRQVCYHPSYPLFASASDDGSVIVCHGMVYNDLMQNPLIVPVKILHGHQATKDLGVLDCIFHPTQPWIFSSGSDQTVRLFT